MTCRCRVDRAAVPPGLSFPNLLPTSIKKVQFLGIEVSAPTPAGGYDADDVELPELAGDASRRPQVWCFR